MSEIKQYVAEGELCGKDERIMPPQFKPKNKVNWLKQEISQGLGRLVVLHLEGCPASETIKQTADVWFVVLNNWPIEWIEGLDRPRLKAAFLALAGQSVRWPSPSQLRTVMPARVYPDLALPAPVYPTEQAAANLAKIKEMINTAFKKV